MLLLTVNSEFSSERDVLADWETEDILWAWKGKAVAVCMVVSIVMMVITRVGMKYMAVLWDRIVFSLSSNSWSSFGLRTLETSVILY